MKTTNLLISLLCAGLWLGCGDDDPTDPEVDASTDGGGPDATVTPTVGTCGVSMTFTNNDGSIDGISEQGVVFSGPDGAYLGWAVTDVLGDASFDGCVNGTMISVVDYNGGDAVAGDFYIRTITGIEPGTIVPFRQRQSTAPRINARVTVSDNVSGVPGLSVPGVAAATAGAPTWHCYAAVCQGPASSPPPGGTYTYGYNNHEYCGSQFNVLHWVDTKNNCYSFDYSLPGQNNANTPFGFSWAKVDPELAPDDGYTDFTTSAWVPPVTLAMSASNAPPFIEGLQLRANAGIPQYTVYSRYRNFSPSDAVAGTYSADVAIPPGGYYGRLETEVEVDFGGGYYAAIRDFGSSSKTAWAVDLADLLPRLQGVVLDTSDRTRPVIRWQGDGPVAANRGNLYASWGDDENFVRWNVHLDASAAPTSFTLPELPDVVAFLRPRAATEFGNAYAYFLDYSWLDWSDLLEMLFDDYVDMDETAPDGGRLRLTSDDD